MQKLRFNIIYTPGSVESLKFLVLSLLDWTDFNFRLISNGCKRAEAGKLREFCELSDRLEYFHFITMPTRQLREWKQAPHGMVLNKLQKMEDSNYFAFMDSDVFAVDKLTTDQILRDLKGHAGIFSGNPLWSTEKDQLVPSRTHRFNDPQNTTECGVCIGTSYFAVYDNNILNQLMRTSRVRFDVYRKQTSVQRQNHQKLENLGVGADIYDTGKYLNILLQANRYSLKMKAEYPVRHIGGMSFWHIGHEHRMTMPWIARKHASQRYFGRLMQCLAQSLPFDDDLDIEDAEVRERIFKARDDLIQLYQRYNH